MYVTLFAAINLYEIDFTYDIISIKSSNILAISFIAIILVIPLLLLIFYYMNRKNWKDPKFIDKYGTYIEDIK